MAEIYREIAIRYCIMENMEFISVASKGNGFYAWNEDGHHVYVPFNRI